MCTNIEVETRDVERFFTSMQYEVPGRNTHNVSLLHNTQRNHHPNPTRTHALLNRHTHTLFQSRLHRDDAVDNDETNNANKNNNKRRSSKKDTNKTVARTQEVKGV
jgi:hypothetical protein